MDRQILESKLERLHLDLSELRPPSAAEERLTSFVVTDQIDLWGNYLYIDPRAEDVLGYAPSYYRQEHDWVAFNHPEDIWRTDILWKRAFAGQSILNVEYRTEDYDGYWVWLEDSFRPLEIDDQGQALVVEGCWRDITPRKRREIEFLIRQFEFALRSGRGTAGIELDNLIQFPLSVSGNGKRRRPAPWSRRKRLRRPRGWRS